LCERDVENVVLVPKNFRDPRPIFDRLAPTRLGINDEKSFHRK
jgi:hypothetical protein